jgi:DNA polymerase V
MRQTMNPYNDKLTFYVQPVITAANTFPIVTERVSAGFPSPVDNNIDEVLDLNNLLIKNPSATFFVRVDGDSMINAGIYSGDILIVDKSLDASNNDVVIAILNGEFTLKRLIIRNGEYILQPENPIYKSIVISEGSDFEIWGKVVSVIHKF